MKLFLFLAIVVVAVVASLVWLFKKLSDIKNETFSEAEMKIMTETRLAMQKKKDAKASDSSPTDPPAENKPSEIKPSEIKQDPDSEIKYE